MNRPDSATDKNVVRKTSDEIKKGLECCGKGNACRGHCPYDGPENGIKGCTGKLSRDALAYIEQLEEALLLMVYQYCQEDDDCVSHRYMVAGEHAFAALGIENYCSIETISKRLDEMEDMHKMRPSKTPKEEKDG